MTSLVTFARVPWLVATALVITGGALQVRPAARAVLAVPPPPTVTSPREVAASADACLFPAITPAALERWRMGARPEHPLIAAPSDRLWMELPETRDADAGPVRRHGDRRTRRCMTLIEHLDLDHAYDLGYTPVQEAQHAEQAALFTAIGIAYGGACQAYVEARMVRHAYDDDRDYGQGCGVSPDGDARVEWSLAADASTSAHDRRLATANAARIAFRMAESSFDVASWEAVAVRFDDAARLDPDNAELFDAAIDARDNAIRTAREGLACTRRADLAHLEAGLTRAAFGAHASIRAWVVLTSLPDR